MNSQKHTQVRRLRRRNHVRRKIHGTVERPRLTVFRSSKHIYAQLIDDMNGHTIISVGSLTPDLRKEMPYGGNIKAAQAVGRKLAEVAKEKGITKAAFDRGHYRYHGRIKALAEAANAAGLLCCEPKPKKKARMEAEAAATPAQAEPAAASGKKEKKEKKSK